MRLQKKLAAILVKATLSGEDETGLNTFYRYTGPGV